MGSWDIIAGLGQNLAPDWAEFGGSGNYVSSDLPVALCGVDDLIVVVRNGRVLVCRKGESQLVKDAAEKLGMG